jgi:hypothetical protein
MRKAVHVGYVVTFLDGLGHQKEMLYLKEREYNAKDAAARLHGTCHDVFYYIEDNTIAVQTLKKEDILRDCPCVGLDGKCIGIC